MNSSSLTPRPIEILFTVEDGILNIRFDDAIVADTAAERIVRDSALARFASTAVHPDTIRQIRLELNSSIARLQGVGLLVWDAFTRKWEIRDCSNLAHLQEGRA